LSDIMNSTLLNVVMTVPSSGRPGGVPKRMRS
jgi:hypothetical protein